MFWGWLVVDDACFCPVIPPSAIKAGTKVIATLPNHSHLQPRLHHPSLKMSLIAVVADHQQGEAGSWWTATNNGLLLVEVADKEVVKEVDEEADEEMDGV